MSELKWAEKLRKNPHDQTASFGIPCVEAFHYLALFGIGATTAYAAITTLSAWSRKSASASTISSCCSSTLSCER
jgi:hypothetical protein